jgi:hypothetical protein
MEETMPIPVTTTRFMSASPARAYSEMIRPDRRSMWQL